MKTNEQEREEVTQDEPTPPSGGPPAVDLSEADDDDGPDDKGTPVPGSGRKPQRTREFIKELRTERDQLRSEREAFQRELAELRGRMSAAAERPAQREEPSGDPVAEQVKTIRSQQRTIMTALRNPNLTEGETEKLQDQWQDLDDRRVDLLASRRAPAREDEGDRSIADGARYLEMNYPEVMGKRSLRLEAELEASKLMESGRLRGFAAAKEGCEIVKRRHLMGERPRPTDADKARLSSTTGRAGANGTGGDKWQPSKQHLALARAWCNVDGRRDLEDSEKLRIWAREVGQKERVIS